MREQESVFLLLNMNILESGGSTTWDDDLINDVCKMLDYDQYWLFHSKNFYWIYKPYYVIKVNVFLKDRMIILFIKIVNYFESCKKVILTPGACHS